MQNSIFLMNSQKKGSESALRRDRKPDESAGATCVESSFSQKRQHEDGRAAHSRQGATNARVGELIRTIIFRILIFASAMLLLEGTQ